jgi:hypothetical protein
MAFQYNPAIGPSGLMSVWVNGSMTEQLMIRAVTIGDRSATDIVVGSSSRSTDSVTNANIYLLNIYDRVLTAEEIRVDIGSMPVVTTTTTTTLAPTTTTSTTLATTIKLNCNTGCNNLGF